MSTLSTIATGKPFRAKAGVYALVDPRSNRVMYVGQSIDIDYRYRQHLDGDVFSGNPAKHRWIAELKREGLSPRLELIAECDYPQSDAIEINTIRQFKLTGQCELNIAIGGQGNRGVSKLKNSHRDQWFQLGRKVKAVHVLLNEIAVEAGEIGGPKATGFVIEAIHGVDRLKARLQGLLLKVYPEWSDLSRVFFGPGDPGDE